MHRALSARWLSKALRVGDTHVSTRVPLFLCPAIYHGRNAVCRRAPALAQRRELHSDTVAPAQEPPPEDPTTTTTESDETAAKQPPAVPPMILPSSQSLPTTCTGCGAFSQTHDPKQFGYYNLEMKRVQKWLNNNVVRAEKSGKEEEQIVNQALQNMSPEQLEALGMDPATMLRGELPDQAPPTKNAPAPKSLVCDRCHTLAHNNFSDVEMFHPTVDSLKATIEESPHTINHVYHVIDAADFPMSLVPRLNVLLGDIRLRTKNRRSRKKFIDDRLIEMTFVITRADLLGPTKESVDRLMPYLQEVLRDALGRVGDRVRLGNVTAVSAKRGWWTRPLKAKIFKQGGANWLVGMVNVGKSALFEAIYPKGRLGKATPSKDGRHSVDVFPGPEPTSEEDFDKDEGKLLPPMQPLKQYPDMPIVSSKPGTTASPIRVPFGNNKGELIDLPGLERNTLDIWVRPEHRKSLIMQNRIVPEQRSVPATRSLVLGGGLIRITPASQDLHFLMYNFTPLHDHLTSTPKAIEMQNQSRNNNKAEAWTPGMENIALDGTSHRMSHAGRFELKTDVSKMRAGPLTRKDSVNLTVDRLPFRVLSVDLLIEGVGYVEIVCQVRKSYLEHSLKHKKHWAAVNLIDRKRRRLGEDDRDAATLKMQAGKDPFAAMTEQRHEDIKSFKDRRREKFDGDVSYLENSANFDHAFEPDWPAVDVYSPGGRHISTRAPIQGWMVNKPLVKPEHRKRRPRRSVKGEKKRVKKERRAASKMALDSMFNSAFKEKK